MNISDVDLKRLWGKAAGKCSFPGCSNDCIRDFEKSGEKILGEMAHVIPQSSGGPRGTTGVVGPDTYENLILLCSNHHTIVDKAPKDFTEGRLRQLKQNHEEHVQSSFKEARYEDMPKLAEEIERLLQMNCLVWTQFGPESESAEKNPYSSAARIWAFQKLSTVVPNNARIAQLLATNKHLVTPHDWHLCTEFIQHASAFEQNAYHRMDSDAVPRFPKGFGAFISNQNKNVL